MRYLIRRSTASASGSERSFFDNSNLVTQHRGKILVFIFVLSLVTTLFSLINFHHGLSPSNEMGIIRLHSASRMFGISRHSQEMMEKSQMYRFLMRRHNQEIRSLKSRLVRGSLGTGSGNKTVNSSSGEKVSGEESNTTSTSRDSSVVMPVSPLLINFLWTVPTKMSHREPRGLFFEYYSCGGNTSLSLTSPLEQSKAWRGVVLYAGNDEGGKLKSQRRYRTHVGAGFQLCLHDDYRLRSKKISVHRKKKLPRPHPVAAPQLETHASENKLATSTLKDIYIAASNYKTDSSESRIVSRKKCPTQDDNMPCLSLFSLTQFFQTLTIDFFAIHAFNYGQDLKLILQTILSLRPLIQIKVISIIVPRMDSMPIDNNGLQKIIYFMKNMDYKYQSLPLYPEEKIESVLRGARKVNGQIRKHTVIKELYKDTVKQHLFVSNIAFINISEHFNTYFN